MENIKGLSENQVKAKQKEFGYNEIPHERESDSRRLLKKLWSPIPWMIEIAAVLSAVLFIKLDVAGHSTLYLTRAGRHHFWHKPFPSLKFFLPAFSSRIIGTLIAVYGIFMAPIGWKYAGYMWLYATVWWIFNNYIKVLTYKFLDRNKAT